MLVYNALILPHFDYCCEDWDGLGKGLSELLKNLQNRAARLTMDYKKGMTVYITSWGRTVLGWTALEERRSLMKAKSMHKTVNQLALQRFYNIFKFSNSANGYNLRGSSTGPIYSKAQDRIIKKRFRLQWTGVKL